MKKVFVVGAGANTDFGMPVGSGLIESIRVWLINGMARRHENDPIAIAQQSGMAGDYLAASRAIVGGMVAARSIDRFLDSRNENELVVLLGKIAIAEAILRHERHSPLGNESKSIDWYTVHNAVVKSSNSWLGKLFSLMSEGRRLDQAEIIFKDVTFMTFNYDRCIECYLFFAFNHIFGLTKEQAIEIVAQIPVYHIYGSLGSWAEDSNYDIEFGADEQKFLRASSLIKTFSEGCFEPDTSKSIFSIQCADLVTFLGFAFDKTNVNTIFPEPLPPHVIVRGTCHGVPPIATSYASDKMGNGAINFQDSKCIEYLSNIDYQSILLRN